MCLEEMYHTQISEGAVFYISSHRRQAVSLDAALRQKVQATISDIERIRMSHWVPPAEYGPKCSRCSIREFCMPELQTSALDYCRNLEKEAKKVESL
jgi:CRISPR-associated exonuclease Cas4